MIKKAWNLWRRFGELLGNLIARVLLSLFYFTLFAPFAIGLRLLGDPLQIRRGQGPAWLARQALPDDLSAARRQA
jgi:hypothetical protein